ncbi:HNH endonuclease [Micromonospora kangleipakensis]|uniref:HNH endonuclease n=1 Tax=Micromonospora kangleipakensis TaxID=1077942 RepID=A0A4Q8B989_9ACTN|nr:HNH endonuclease signature motif containing protein [Micromonospora kangleipakensis]RZU73489.1 HNH endonuclease [Micromonospora kangleipakensis]
MAVSGRTRKIIWVESGGRCAICHRQVLTPATETDDPSIFGEEAHIVPASPGGPRAAGRLGMTQAQIDHHSNLILLCSPCHKRVDDQPNHFTIEELHRIKRAHREWIASLGEQERPPARQAEKVTAWPSIVLSDPADPNSAPAWGATIRNASELPVYQVHVEFVPIERWRGLLAVVIEVVPPGDWLVSGRKVYPKPDRAALRPDTWEMPERTYVTELRFTDTNGQTWHRDRRGVLAEVP